MSLCHATLDCRSKIVEFKGKNGLVAGFQGDQVAPIRGMISAIQARKMLQKGYRGLIAQVKEVVENRGGP